MARLSGIPLPTQVAWTYGKHNWLQPLLQRPFLPTKLVFYVTYRCNSRCAMCGIWENVGADDQGSELSPADLGQILADPLFARVEQLNINGGEPTLRGDLVDLAGVAIGRLRRLRWISMNSNGILTDELVPAVERLRRLCAQRRISFSLILSVHGVGPAADRINGTEGTFGQQLESLRALRKPDPAETPWLSLLCVISRLSWPNVEELLRWSEEMGLPITFTVGEVRERFHNQHKAGQITLTAQQKHAVIGFLRGLSQQKGPLRPSAFRYHHLANMLQYGEERTMACHYAMGGVILGSQGELYYCPHSRALGNSRTRSAHDTYYDAHNLQYHRSALIQDECLRCLPYTFDRQEFKMDILRYLEFLARSQQP